MYFHKRKLSRDPFSKLGIKREVYHYFFRRGKEMGFDTYIASGKENYLGELRFKDPFFYDGRKFVPEDKIIMMDAAYDRSGGISFPPKEINKKVLNRRSFKILCNDKNKMYELLGDFMPKSFEIKNVQNFKTKVRQFNPDDLAVLKPARGLCGKGIIINKAKNISREKLVKKYFPYVLQEFVDTSFGIKNITPGKHDLRIIIVDGKMVLAHVRTPKKGSYLANVAQGGKIKELPIQRIPKRVTETVREVQKIIDKKFNYPVYSIDFGISNGKPYIFELNDQIGFPSAKMKNYKKFIDGLLVSLEKLSYNRT